MSGSRKRKPYISIYNIERHAMLGVGPSHVDLSDEDAANEFLQRLNFLGEDEFKNSTIRRMKRDYENTFPPFPPADSIVIDQKFTEGLNPIATQVEDETQYTQLAGNYARNYGKMLPTEDRPVHVFNLDSDGLYEDFGENIAALPPLYPKGALLFQEKGRIIERLSRIAQLGQTIRIQSDRAKDLGIYDESDFTYLAPVMTFDGNDIIKPELDSQWVTPLENVYARIANISQVPDIREIHIRP